MGPSIAILLLVTGLAQAALPVRVSSVGLAQERESLEEMLARQRARRAAVLARLEGEVRAFMDGFARLQAPIAPEREQELCDRLVGLGPEAAALLVPYLEPGASPTATDLARGRAVAAALSTLGEMSVTDALLGMLATGSAGAKRNALRALEGSPEPERARPLVQATFDGADTSLRAPALTTLIRMGGPGNAELFARILTSSDAELVKLSLQALIDSGDAGAAPQVALLLGQTSKASQHVPLLLKYYVSQRQVVDADVLALWVALVPRVPSAPLRIAILAALPDLAGSNGTQLKRLLEPLAQGGDPDVVEAAQVALARLGDRNARREALRTYDDFVEKNPRIGEAFLRRAQLLMRMQEWDEATKDFQSALRVSKDDARPLNDAYLGLARAYARRGKLKDAAEWLRKAPISMRELHDLAKDPDFSELRASRYGKEVWGS